MLSRLTKLFTNITVVSSAPTAEPLVKLIHISVNKAEHPGAITDPQSVINNPFMTKGKIPYQHPQIHKNTCDLPDCHEQKQGQCPSTSCGNPLPVTVVGHLTHNAPLNPSQGTPVVLSTTQDASGAPKKQEAVFYTKPHHPSVTPEIPQATAYINTPAILPIIEKYAK